MAATDLLVLLLLGCATDASGPPADPGDTAAPDRAAPDTAAADVPPDCGVLALTWSGAAAPGVTLELSAAAGPDATGFAWEVEAGTLSDADGAAVSWTLPADAAVHRAETLEVSVTVTGGKCAAQTVAEDVEVDWPEAARVVVIYNPSVEGSEDVALRYAAFRGVDALCPVPYADATTLAGADYPAWVVQAQACIDAVGPHVHFLVPVYGVPYKVSERITEPIYGYPATTSLDALLAIGADGVGQATISQNPLYQDGDSMAGTYDPWIPIGNLLHRRSDTWYLVTRIDGADAQAALDLVDRTELAEELAANGALSGIVYVDGRYGDTAPATDDFGSYEGGEWNMWGTRALFEGLDWYPVVWDANDAEFGTAPAPTECPNALYYAGWYSYDNYNDAFTWAPGAVGGHLDSCSACDLRDGSWAAEALQRGVTATFGAVNEPYVAGMPEYDQFFLYLTQGASFAEAAYESTAWSFWMMVWVGDPLYRPYPSSHGRDAAASSRFAQ